MSVEFIGWVFRQDIPVATRKLVLLALADFAGQDGIAWATIETLIAKTSLNRKTVITAIGDLSKEGYLCDTGERRGATGQIKIYRIVTDGHDSTELNKQYRKRNSTENGTVPKTDTKSTDITGKESQKRIQRVPILGNEPLEEPLYEPVIEPSLPPTPNGGEVEDAFTPDELKVEPVPMGLPKAKREAERKVKDELRTVLMAAFRKAKYDRPYTDPISPAEFDRMRSAADDLLAAKATPEQVECATARALDRWSDSARVTLRAVAGNLTELLTEAKVKPEEPYRTPSQKAADARVRSTNRFFEELEEELTQGGSLK